MTTTVKIYLVAAAMLAAAYVLSTAWSVKKTHGLEAEVETARRSASETETSARQLEQKTLEYRAKIDFLESRLAEIQIIAGKQNEEIQKLNSDTDAARTAVGRSQRVRAISSTTAELCRKLAELGHGCDRQ